MLELSKMDLGRKILTRSLAACLSVAMLSSCQAPTLNEKKDLLGHALNVDPRGKARFVYDEDADPETDRIAKKGHRWIDPNHWESTHPDAVEHCRYRPNPHYKDMEFDPDLDRAIDQIMLKLHDHFTGNAEPGIHVVLFIHGGLSSLEKGTALSHDVLDAIGPNPDFFPIFINWDTDFIRASYNHVFRVRNGRDTRRAWVDWPLTLLADFGRTVGRIGRVMWDQGQYIVDGRKFKTVGGTPQNWEHVNLPKNGKHRLRWLDYARAVFPGVLRLITVPAADMFGQGAYKNMERRARVLFVTDKDHETKRHQTCGAVSRLMNELRVFERRVIWQGQENYEYGFLDRVRVAKAQYIRQKMYPNEALHRWQEDRSTRKDARPLPLCRPKTENETSKDLEIRRRCEVSKYGYGIRDYRNDAVNALRVWQQERRAQGSEQLLCRKPDEPSASATRDGVHRRRLEHQCIVSVRRALRKEPILRISIIAHSMGALIANEILDRNGDLYFEDVVYLAAANSIRDFASQALPYLKQNPTSVYHNYLLHPVREYNEQMVWGLLPQGSLLTVIDRFLSKANTETDHTMGRWSNLKGSLTLLKDLEGEERRRFRVNVFGSSSVEPKVHGDFNNLPVDDQIPFWEWHAKHYEKPSMRNKSHRLPLMESQLPR